MPDADAPPSSSSSSWLAEAAAEQLALELTAFRFASSSDSDPDTPRPQQIRTPTPTQMRPLSRTRSRSRSVSLSLGLSLGPNQDPTQVPVHQHRNIKKKRILKVDEASSLASLRTVTPTPNPTPAATPIPAPTPVPTSAAGQRAATSAASLPRPPKSQPLQQQKLVPTRFSSLGLFLDTHATSIPTEPQLHRPPAFAIPPPPAFSPPILSPPAEPPVPHTNQRVPSKISSHDIPQFPAQALRVRPQRRDSVKHSKGGSLPLPASAISNAAASYAEAPGETRTISEYSPDIDAYEPYTPTINLQTIKNTFANSGPVLQSFDSRLQKDSSSGQSQQPDASDEVYFQSLPRTFAQTVPLQSRSFSLQPARSFKSLLPTDDFQLPNNFVPIPTDEYYPPKPVAPTRGTPTSRFHNSHSDIVVPQRSASMAMFAPLPSPSVNIAAVETGLPPAWTKPQAMPSQANTTAMQPPPFAAATLTRRGGDRMDVQRQSRRSSVPQNMHESLPPRGKSVFSRVGVKAGGVFGRGTGSGGVSKYERTPSSATAPMASDATLRSNNAIEVAFSLGVDADMYEVARERAAANARARELESDYLDSLMAGLFRSKSRSRVVG
ncbi:hypothetical protein HDU83_002089 [Entophlyctis luteolus]|nr:hypothetical protein HDU83_002089 [Entophlyctis luteolus]KAJ3380760.1 hypothetical protein HDU84_005615 [Entophlyctis sp. JEL0112]